MLGRLLAVVSLGVLFLTCPLDTCNNSPTGPEEPPTTTTTPPEPVQPPRVDQPFNWDNYVGFSAFAAVGNTPEENTQLWQQNIAVGFPVGRVCGEVRSWDQHGLRVVPAEIELLDTFLDTTARIPGAFVLLNCICNMKEDGATKSAMRLWVQQIANLVKEKNYKHVALSPGNELWHPASSIRGDEAFMEELLLILRDTGQPITMDWNAYKRQDGSLRVQYPEKFRRLGAYPNLHPWRSPDPNRREIAEMVTQNGGRVLISEPTCYSETRDDGACTNDRARIKLYACRAKREHALWTFHSDFGLESYVPYPWVPNWNLVCDY